MNVFLEATRFTPRCGWFLGMEAASFHWFFSPEVTRLHVLDVLDTPFKTCCLNTFPWFSIRVLHLFSLKIQLTLYGSGRWSHTMSPDRSQGPITLTFCGQQTTLRPWDPSTCGGISRWVVFFGWFFPDIFWAGKERSSDFIMWNKILSISVEIRDFRSEDEDFFGYTYIPPRRADSETLHVGAVQCQLGEMNGATTGLPTTVWK